MAVSEAHKVVFQPTLWTLVTHNHKSESSLWYSCSDISTNLPLSLLPLISNQLVLFSMLQEASSKVSLHSFVCSDKNLTANSTRDSEEARPSKRIVNRRKKGGGKMRQTVKRSKSAGSAATVPT